ncbi:thioredoxin family protein [Pseudomonas sp. TE3610]
MKLKSLTDDDFEDTILNTEGAVLIAFATAWSGPSKILAPVLDEVSNRYLNRVSFFKVDADAAPAAAARCGLYAVPTLLIFKGELTPTARIEGAISQEKLVAFIDKNL